MREEGSVAANSSGSALGARTAEVWTLVCIYLGGSLGCLLGALRPFSPDAPVTLSFAFSGISAVGALVLWLVSDRFGRPLLIGGVVLGVVVISVVIANVATVQGASLTAFAYLWAAVYSAHFFSRRQALAQAGLISICYATALAVNDLPGAGKTYVVVVGTVWAAVTVLTNVVSKMRDQADTDQLTGLLNRAGFRTAAEREHALARRTGLPLSLAVIDLDGFKAVNDSHGHAAGDRMLGLIAEKWRAALRECDLIGRHGGDEFVLLLPATAPDVAGIVLDRLRAISPLAWSAGVAAWDRAESLDECLGRADQALYRAKVLRPPRLPEQRGQPAPRPATLGK